METAHRTDGGSSRDNAGGQGGDDQCTPNGTDLRLAIRGRPVLADTGILNRPGAFSNLPAGEVFLAPLEGKTDGRLVLEWAPTRRLASPVTLYVRKGIVTRIAGREPYADELRRRC